jgi:hypothetical protein
MDNSASAAWLEAWTAADLSLLRRANTPEMMAHLGGPETEAKLLGRHQRYLQRSDPGAGQMFAVVLPDEQRAGIIGYWERPWRDEMVYETGWNVLPGFQGRGIASAAEPAGGPLWLPRRRPGREPVVVFTASLLSYLGPDARKAFSAQLTQAAADRPVAWVFAEGPALLASTDSALSALAGPVAHPTSLYLIGVTLHGPDGRDDALLALADPYLRWLALARHQADDFQWLT